MMNIAGGIRERIVRLIASPIEPSGPETWSPGSPTTSGATIAAVRDARFLRDVLEEARARVA